MSLFKSFQSCKVFILPLFCLLFINTYAQKIALNFLGDDDWVLGTNSALPQGNAPRTIETWIKYNTSKDDMSIFNYGTFANNQKFTLHLYQGVYIIGEGNDLSTGYVFNDGQWHHLAVTHDGTTTIVYVDGIERGRGNRNYNTTGVNFQMGASSRVTMDFRFQGTIDELRVWNVARTQQEISQNMSKLIQTAPGLIAYYSFNDGVPNGDNTAITTVADRSGNGLSGTLTNFALTGTSSNFVDDAITLPMKLLSFSALESNCNALLKWETEAEDNVKQFLVEKSNDGVYFTDFKTIRPSNLPGAHSYTADLTLSSKQSFYRLKMIDSDNKFTYSKTLTVQARRCGVSISLMPNPAKNKLVIQTENYTNGREFRIFNSGNILVRKGVMTNTIQNVDISKLSAGTYYLQITGADPMIFIKQ